MAKDNQVSIKTGAMTLVLLVKYYKSQMVALLLKNGVTVPNGASDQQIASLMANLLKVSKSFFTDLNNFIQNPKVLAVVAGEFQQNAQYFRASGYYNGEGDEEYDDAYFEEEDPALPTPTGTTPKKGGFLSGLNLGNLIKDGLDAFGKYDKNKTDREIADARAKAGLPVLTEEELVVEREKVNKGKTPDTKISTTTIVVLSLVGVAVLGTIIYFVARPKQ
jgi:hypothetical protein